MRDNAANTYDEMPYGARVHPATHPDRLAVIGTLFGMNPAPPERCRVLELGCAGGGNLLALARERPGSRFVGIDLSARQIAAGRKQVRESGLSNVDLRAMDLLEIGEELGRFDYILCHGVYSWVPAAVRDQIMSVCAASLEPQGIAYISYNCYPGWHARGVARDLMLYHAGRTGDLRECVRRAREVLDFVAASVRDPQGRYGRTLSEEVERLVGTPDDYVFHEHLEAVNQPVYFHQFAAHAAAHGLQYLWEAYVGELGSDLRPEVIRAVAALAPDLIAQQQYVDFLTDRLFRSSLLCHAGVVLDRTIPPGRMTAFRVVGVAVPQSESPDVGSAAIEVFNTLEGAGMSTNNPVFKAALTGLAARAPHAFTFDELCAATRAGLARTAVAQPVPDDQLPSHVADLLRQGALARLVELHVSGPRTGSQAADRRPARRRGRSHRPALRTVSSGRPSRKCVEGPLGGPWVST
jgi:cyclopropane fatty-acyl-phospholipid synthase-like methyltransferase